MLESVTSVITYEYRLIGLFAKKVVLYCRVKKRQQALL